MTERLGTAVWECPRCHRIMQFEVYGTMTHGPGPRVCTCYSIWPAQGCVELRSIVHMDPLNELAKMMDRLDAEWYQRFEAERLEQEASRRRAQDYLDSWG